MSRHIKTLAIILIAGLCLVACGKPLNESDVPDVQLSLAWEGLVQAPGWTEINVQLTTDQDAWTGQIRIADKNNKLTYIQDVSISNNVLSNTRIPAYLTKVGKLSLEILQDDRTIYQEDIEPNFQSSVCAFIGHSATIPDEILPNCKSSVILTSWQMVPTNPLIWESIDRLYITSALSADESPTLAHLDAMQTWVSQGGHLSISGESSLNQINASQDWLNIVVSQPVSNRIPKHDPGWQFTFPTPLQSCTLGIIDSPDTQAALTDEENLILAAEQAYGWGRIVVSGWQSTQTPIEWHVLNDTPPVQRLTSTAQEENNLHGNQNIAGLFTLPDNNKKQGALLLILFMIYILGIGPGMLLLTRKRTQPLLTWVLVPLWIGASIAIMGMVLQGTLSKAYPVTNEIALVEFGYGTKQAKVTQLMALFAPRSRSLTWTTTAYGKPLLGKYQSDYWYGDGDPFAMTISESTPGMRDYASDDTIGVMTWASDAYISLPKMEINLSSDQDDTRSVHITGDIQSELALSNVFLVYANGTYAIQLTESLDAGEKLSLDDNYPLLYNDTPQGYLDFCDVGQSSSYWGYYSYPAVTSPLSFPKVGAHGRVYTVPNSGLCHIVATSDMLPLSQQDLTDSMGTTCLLIALPCPTP